MAENLMTIAYENGVNLFDTAEVYASGRSDFTVSTEHQLNLCISFFYMRFIDSECSLSQLKTHCSVCFNMFAGFIYALVLLCCLLQLITTTDVLLHRAEITLGNIIKKKGWR